MLSPTLFIMNGDDVVKESERKTRKMQILYNQLKSVGVFKSVFVDDLMICAASEN